MRAHEIGRREFVKGAVAAGGAAALAELADTVASAKEPSAATSGAMESGAAASAGPDRQGGIQDGVWIGQAMGHRDWLTAQVTVSGGAVTGISCLRCDDTIGIGSVAAPMMVRRITDAGNNLDVDVVSGASFTSMAVKTAIENAITAAGGNPEEYHRGKVDPETGTDHQGDVDVVIVGAGTSGLVAAVRLLEAGKKVTVLEQLDIAGGSGNMTYSGVVAVGSELQKNYSQGRFEESVPNDFDLQAKLATCQSYNVPENSVTGDESLPYQTALYGNSGALVDWLHETGVGFMTMGAPYGTTCVLAPGMYMGGCGYTMGYLADRVVALGGELDYHTVATSLIQADDGTVTGVEAEDRDGSTFSINASAVCLCTGGFAANQDLVAQYYPQYADFTFNCCKGSTGAGLQMALDAGAYTECMGRDLGAFNSVTPDAAGTRFEVAFLAQFAGGLMVNDKGDEFGKGRLSHAFMASAITNPDNGGRFFHVTDHAGAIKLQKMDTWACTDYAALFDRGDIVHYDTVQEAVEELGLPDLSETIDSHNRHALAGEEDEFGRTPGFLNINDGIWVVSCMPTFYLTTGGIGIDTAGHVLTDGGASTISGLYAAGDIAGSIEEKDGNMYGYGFDSALTYGFIMANTIIAEQAK